MPLILIWYTISKFSTHYPDLGVEHHILVHWHLAWFIATYSDLVHHILVQCSLAWYSAPYPDYAAFILLKI